MASLCYKCSQRKAVVDAKLDARRRSANTFQHGNHEIQEFEAYLYQNSPLCKSCTSIVSIAAPLSRSTNGKRKQSCGVTQVLVCVMCCMLLLVLLYIYHTGISIFDKPDIAPLLQALYDLPSYHHVALHLRDITNITLSFKITSEDVYPNNLDGFIYCTVLIIQVTTLVLRQYDCTSILASLASYSIYKVQFFNTGSHKTYYDVARYIILAVALLLVFTKKTTVVSVSQRKVVQKPVIKVRRSPKKKESSPLDHNLSFFSDDEDCKPEAQKPANQSTASVPRDLQPANQSTASVSRDLPTANPGTPLKDVRNKFDILKISSSPLKAPNFSGGAMSSEKRKGKRHTSCLKPASFSVNTPDSKSSERPRFDSTCSEEAAQKIEPAKLPLKPIVLVLVVSVVMNYYLLVNYVLS